MVLCTIAVCVFSVEFLDLARSAKSSIDQANTHTFKQYNTCYFEQCVAHSRKMFPTYNSHHQLVCPVDSADSSNKRLDQVLGLNCIPLSGGTPFCLHPFIALPPPLGFLSLLFYLAPLYLI